MLRSLRRSVSRSASVALIPQSISKANHKKQFLVHCHPVGDWMMKNASSPNMNLTAAAMKDSGNRAAQICIPCHAARTRILGKYKNRIHVCSAM